MTLAEAAQRLGKSERTIRRLIEGGRIQAQKDKNGKWIVTDLGDEDPSDGSMASMVKHLQVEVEYLREENKELRRQLEESRMRSDTIILRLTENQKLLEDLRLPFWRRWIRRKPESPTPSDAGK